MQAHKRGAFIVFEGLDRSGKSTQTNLLLNFLKCKNINTTQMRFPDRETSTGKIISDYLTNKIELDDKEIHKLFADNRKEKVDQIKELLYKGTNVICDRYAFSGVAFSSAKGLDLEWCKDADRGIPEPDLVIYLKMPLTKSQEREDYGKERYENIQMQTKVKQIYEDSLFDPRYWREVNADQPISEVEEEIRRHTLEVLSDSKLKSEALELWKIDDI